MRAADVSSEASAAFQVKKNSQKKRKRLFDFFVKRVKIIKKMQAAGKVKRKYRQFFREITSAFGEKSRIGIVSRSERKNGRVFFLKRAEI